MKKLRNEIAGAFKILESLEGKSAEPEKQVPAIQNVGPTSEEAEDNEGIAMLRVILSQNTSHFYRILNQRSKDN